MRTLKDNTKIINLQFILLGVISATVILCINKIDSNVCVNQMPARVDMLQSSLDSIQRGEIPDVRQSGFYTFVPYLALKLGYTDSMEVLALCQNVYLFMFISILPMLLYWLLKSRIAILTPVLLYFYFAYIIKFYESPYYAFPWGGVLSLVLLALIMRENISLRFWIMVYAECLVISLSNLVRPGSVVASPILLFVIVLMKEYKNSSGRSVWIKLVSVFRKIHFWVFVFILLFSYSFLDTGVAKIIYHNPNANQETVISQPWHNMYIGMGYGDNPEGIFYKDECAIAKVAEIDPNATYLSEEYFDIIKSEYFDFLKKYPVWSLGCYFRKFAGCIFNSFAQAFVRTNKIFVVLSIICFIYVFIKDKIYSRGWIRNHLEYLVVGFLIYLAGMIQGIMAVPVFSYISGATGVICLVEVLVVLRALQIVLQGKYSKREN